MVTTIKRTKEKGERTPRSMDAYNVESGVEGAAYCECGAVFRNKRWYSEEVGAISKGGHVLVCPACRRIADRNPAGIVCLRGSFLTTHEAEIENLIRNTAQIAGMKHPLGRIMDISKEKDGITITTTDIKLAQKIGRKVFKSHGGDLHFRWTDDEDLVRVTWSR
jgi:NMD protein affecting ribosome stability and mRNA decay